jgi:hypothetical protein
VLAAAAGLGGYLRPPYDYSPLPQIKSRATNAIVSRVDDSQALQRVGFEHYDPTLRSAIVEFLSRNRRSVFRSSLSLSVGKAVQTAFSGFRSDCIGAVDRVDVVGSLESGGLLVSGWSWNREKKDAENDIVIVNESGIVIGVGTTMEDRPDVNKWDPTITKLKTGWSGYARAVGKTFLAFAYSKSDDKLCLASGIIPISR